MRPNNEDTLWAHPVGTPGATAGDSEGRAASGWPGLLLCAADGMGGALAGEVASSMAVKGLAAEMDACAQSAPASALAPRLVGAVEAVHAAIHAASERDPALRGMGTTLTAAWVVGDELVVGQVGDSRAYLFRKGRLQQLTRDQSLVSKLLEDGVITEAQAATMAGRNIILQALGSEEPLEVVTTAQRLDLGDVLVLCSDGLCGVVDNKAIEADLQRGGAPAELAARLVALAERHGGPDNITVLVARAERP
ncbi:MAG: PP2C family protein-serine/threonine phosphatase [Planctomycetia bacterium]